jgi:hypothetical protein
MEEEMFEINPNFNNDIAIISGEGTSGTAIFYKGKKSIKALKYRLTKERCHSDRWAKAIEFRGIAHDGNTKIGINLETKTYTVYPL